MSRCVHSEANGGEEHEDHVAAPIRSPLVETFLTGLR